MRIVCISMLIGIVSVCGCGNKQAAQQAEVPETFAPRADSVLTARQISRWLAVNPLLDSLSFAYQDSFKTADPAALARTHDSFQKAQNAACETVGMPGGYEEYRYVSRALVIPANRALRDSMGVREM